MFLSVSPCASYCMNIIWHLKNLITLLVTVNDASIYLPDCNEKNDFLLKKKAKMFKMFVQGKPKLFRKLLYDYLWILLLKEKSELLSKTCFNNRHSTTFA